MLKISKLVLTKKNINWSLATLALLLANTLIVYKSPIYASDSIRGCYEKTITYFVGLERVPSNTEIDYAISQCYNTFDGIELIVTNCHKEKINDLALLGRTPTYSEINQAILECSRLDPDSIDNSISLTCTDEPDGYESFNPDKFVNLYDNGEPEFLEAYSTVCKKHAVSIKSKIIAEISNQFEESEDLQYQEAVGKAESNNWLVNGQGIEINHLTDSGIPLYNGTLNWSNSRNYQEAIQAGTDSLWEQFNGEGMNIGLWDLGSVNESHLEYLNRVFWKDDEYSPIDFHPTHVAGTLIASGVTNPELKGMAPNASISAYNWNNNISELLNAGAKTATSTDELLISNHSYGIVTGWTFHASGVPNHSNIYWSWEGVDCNEFTFCHEQEDYKHGLYNRDAYELDLVSFLLPNHLIVKSAGNDHYEGPPAGTDYITWYWNGIDWSQIVSDKARPYDCANEGGYDCLTPDATAKNILTVGAVDDKRKIAAYSNRGPTDDWRIKPDIVAKGDNVSSTWTDDGHNMLSGTSMATPVVSGSLLLLQQKYKSLHQDRAMRAATLKGLVIHSADDVAPAGPDFVYGWGILNTRRASTLLDENNSTHKIIEHRLNNNESYTVEFTAQSNQPIVATLAWTDFPGQIQDDSVDPQDIVLSNDLDLRITGNAITFYPWKMDLTDPAAGATFGDNIRDNVEQVVLHHPIIGQNYQIQVTHKNTLQTGLLQYREICGELDRVETRQADLHQCFSLIISQTETGILGTTTQPARAELNENGLVNLYLPVVNYSGLSYTANFEMLPNTNPIQFILKNYGESSHSDLTNPALLDSASLNLFIPEIIFNDEVWQVKLIKDSSSNSLKWKVGELIKVK